MKPLLSLLSCYVLIPLLVTGCGTYVPQIQESWEGTDVSGNMEVQIKERIYCETRDAIRLIKAKERLVDGTRVVIIPSNYGVQIETLLQVDEASSLNPGLIFTKTLPNAFPSGVQYGQQRTVNLGLSASSQATRIDKTYSFYTVKDMLTENKNALDQCPNKNIPSEEDDEKTYSSPLMNADLGIYNWLIQSVPHHLLLPSSKQPKNHKDFKIDVISYEVRFLVITQGGISPTWKLAAISANTGALPLLSANRSRQHNLIITLGPTDETSTNVHLASQIGTAVSNAIRSPQP